MYYSIRHLTRFRYSAPITESVMEVRVQPRSEGGQRCLSFGLAVDPSARIMAYRDYLGNTVHHFDIPGNHSEITLTAGALVEVRPPVDLPERLDPDAWSRIDALVGEGDYWEMLMPSQFARSSDLLRGLAGKLGVERRADPFSLLREIATGIHEIFAYVPNSTRVDSPIEDALRKGEGVCQDFAHIMIAMVRELRIPCRYVSGYVSRLPTDSEPTSPDATHAWTEALLPGLGWVGFDPTMDVIAGERHIRSAIGRDYADVPPTRGVFKGIADSELAVAVRVIAGDEPLPDEDLLAGVHLLPVVHRAPGAAEVYEQQQQQ
jgi:transglutaminase-like putative cysteine protease